MWVRRSRGDFDGNGVVDLNDFRLFVPAMGTQHARFDIDRDGTVGISDFFLFAERFGRRVDW